MLNSADTNRDEVRRRAEDKLAKVIKREAAIVAYQQLERDSQAAKIARLRALREARDTAEDAAKQSAALEKTASVHSKRADKAAGASERPASRPKNSDNE